MRNKCHSAIYTKIPITKEEKYITNRFYDLKSLDLESETKVRLERD